MAVALDERHAVRDDGVLSVRLLIDIDVCDLRELIHEEIALVTQVVRLAAVILGEHNVLVEDGDLFRNIVCLADLDAHLIVLCIDLILQLTCAGLDAVDEVVALRDDRRTRRRVARVVGEVDPGAVELLHRIEDARLLCVVKDRLCLIVVGLVRLIEVLRRGLRPELLVRVDVACTVQRDDIDTAADVDTPIEGRPLLIVRRRRVHALTRVPLCRGVGNVVPGRVKRQLVVLDAPHHRIESGKC